MADEGFKRKLTAILSADAEGYSRLMGEDEEATVRTLTSYREVLSTLIQQHNGKVLDSPGDNLLAEFVSVVDAVQCAVAVQKEISARNEGLSENRRMQFRIGINLGDVIQEEGRIYGDGVNIAARLEGLAAPGGICISKTAFDHIESKLPYGYDFIGEQTVKNIAKPVGAYRVQLDPRVTVSGKPEKSIMSKRIPIFAGAIVVLVLAIAVGIWQFYQRRPTVEPASLNKMAFPLPEKPSIAVLPFDNMSGNPEDEYIADGLTEDIIAAISKIDAMFVIARNSTFTYKGKPAKVKQVSEEFGVQYVLEGSIQKSGDRLRITAQLIDALTGYHLWADRYDRKIKDIFDIKDEITKKIIAELHVEITDGEDLRLYAKETDNLEAWIHFSKAIPYVFDWTKRENNIRAREHLEQAVKIDPHFAVAYMWLAETHMLDATLKWTENNSESFKQYFELTQKAISLDDSSPLAHDALGMKYRYQGQIEKAIAEGEKAIALEPNNALIIFNLARTMHEAGRPEEAVRMIKRAMRLSPKYPAWFLNQLGQSLHYAGRYDEAITAYEQILERHKNTGEFDPLWPQLGLTTAYLELNQVDKARDHFNEALAITPEADIFIWAKNEAGYKDIERLKRLLEPLQKMYADAEIKTKQYVHEGPPAFKFEYPDGSISLRLENSPNNILRMQTPKRVKFCAYFSDIPEGIELEDFGPKVYLPALERAGVGTNFDLTSNELITLKDGTKANKTSIKWLHYNGKTWITTLIVSAYRENKKVTLTVDSLRDPEEVAWIVESLTFQ